VVRRAPADAADEVVHLFRARDHEVIDHEQKGQVIALRVQGHRRLADDGVDMHEVGSVYYAFVAPNARGRSAVTIIGRPMLDDAELCTQDLRLDAPCTDRYDARHLECELDGRAEARLVFGLFSELRERGVVDDAAVPSHRLAFDRDASRAQGNTALDRAPAHRDPRARAIAHARANKASPTCE
jgi:hypothetical protein